MPADPPVARLLFGTEEAAPAPLALQAGPLSLEWQGGRLLDLRAGDAEVWHAVTWPCRDPDWLTPEPVLTAVRHRQNRDGFRLVLRGHYPVEPGIALRLAMVGTRDGEVRVALRAVPAGDVLVNRLGLCLLHPITAAGARVEVEHDDGRLSRSTLPRLIPSWPPFTLVRAIRHEYAEDRWARCEFAGDVFEVEDQRNNADASFKTYSRSDMMPRPYRLRAGEPVRQSLRLSLDPVPTRRISTPRRPEPLTVRPGGECGAMPRVGVAVVPADTAADEDTLAALRALRPGLLHLPLDRGGGPVDWGDIAALLAAAGAGLRLDVGEDADLCALGMGLHGAGITPESVAVFPGGQAAVDAARAAFPDARIGAGTPHFFVQLNRAERLGAADFLSFTTSSVVHGADDASVMLGLQSLPSMVETLRARHPGRAVRVGPSGIGARASPLGAQPATDGTRRVALARHDPRSRGLYGAAWALAHVARLGEAGAEAVTVMDLTGPSGLLSREGGRLVRRPAFFPLSRLGPTARRHGAAVSDPARAAALALSRQGCRELLLANLTGDALDVAVEGWDGVLAVSVLDADTWPEFASVPGGWEAVRVAGGSRLRLDAYAVASITVPHQAGKAGAGTRRSAA